MCTQHSREAKLTCAHITRCARLALDEGESDVGPADRRLQRRRQVECLLDALDFQVRSAGLRSHQRPSTKARRAARTARSTSAGPQAAACASTVPVAGVHGGEPVAVGTNTPSTKASLRGRMASAAWCQ